MMLARKPRKSVLHRKKTVFLRCSQKMGVSKVGIFCDKEILFIWVERRGACVDILRLGARQAKENWEENF